MPRRNCSLPLSLVLGAFCAVVFLPTLRFGFVTADDASHVAANPVLLGSLWDLWFRPFQVQGLYMPTTYTVWWAAARASLGFTGALDPTWFHGLNWLLHSLNVCLAFTCFRRVGLASTGAAAAALIFGLHPIQVESVAWITALKDVLTGTFVLLCVLSSLNEKWAWASLAFVCAVLAKPVGAVAPFIVGIFLWVSGQSLRKPIRWLGTWSLASAAMLAWTKSLQPGPNFSVWERVQIAADALFFSFTKALVPLGLTLDYGRSPQVILSTASWVPLLGLALLGFLLWRFWGHLPNQNRYLAAAALFIIPWLPVSGVVSFFHQIHSTTADRFLYLSLLGLGLALGTMYEHWKAATVLLALLLATLSSAQIPFWQSNLTLYRRMASVRPTSENFYRYAMALVESGERVEATRLLERAVALNPGEPRNRNNLALLQAEQGKFDEAEAQLRQALSVSPDSETLKTNLATLVRRRLEKARTGQ